LHNQKDLQNFDFFKKNITRALERGRPIISSPVTFAVKSNCPRGDYKGTGQCWGTVSYILIPSLQWGE